MKALVRFLTACTLAVALFSCDNGGFIDRPDALLEFSTDTVLFDTVFTTIGSTTQNFKIYNPHAQTIKIERITLSGHPNSPYRLNINGRKENRQENVEILPHDSLFVFVEVTLNPNGQDSPLVVEDSVMFLTNGNDQAVKLIAFGQDVHLINGEYLSTQTWSNEKPYLVYNSMAIDTAQVLTINPGVRIHFHRGSSLLIFGTLQVNGTVEEPVTFQGDRLEKMYEDLPGQWGSWVEYDNGSAYILGGIHITPPSRDNVINHAIIKNAIKGIQVDTLSNTERPMLTITNSRIENMTVAGIYAQSTTIVAANCLIANCGSWCAALTLGGSYEFYHCTLSNNYGSWYSSSARGEPTLLLNNFFVYNGTAYVYHLYNALFANCIITGSRPIEIGLVNTIDKVPVPGQFNYAFDHCLVKVDTMKTDDPERWIQIVKNHDPRFVSVFNRDYQLDTLSPAKDRGKPEYAQLFPLDLNGRSRLADTKPDIGAYEREE